MTRRQWQLLGFVLVLGLAIRCGIAAHSVGATDAELWLKFASYISDQGLAQTYRDIPYFNHPPLMSWINWLLLELAQRLQFRFISLFKVLTILSEVGCAWLLWSAWLEQGQRQAARVVALFSLNLVSILISSYHGNTDCLFATLCLASAYAFSREKWLWAGLALGAAINVKIVPLMLLPVFVALLPSVRALRLFGTALALCALPFLPVLVLAPEAFYRNVFGYNSNPFQWGIPLLIESTGQTLPRVSSWLAEQYVPNARYAILGCMLLIGGLQRRSRQLSVYEAAALGLSVFLVLAPGFGVQYLVWPLPLLFAGQPRTALKYSLYGGVFALLVYYLFWTGVRPWFSNFTMTFPMPTPFLGVLAWVTLIGFCVDCFRRLSRGSLASQPSLPGPVLVSPILESPILEGSGVAPAAEATAAPAPLVAAELP